jgi:hypothetical protein
MTTMTDREIIAWARSSAYSAHLRGFSEVNQKFRRLERERRAALTPEQRAAERFGEARIEAFLRSKGWTNEGPYGWHCPGIEGTSDTHKAYALAKGTK